MTPGYPESQPLWLCLHFRQLPLEIFTRGLSGRDESKPVVVLERKRVCRLNPAAKGIGILPGNSMDTAYTLSDQVISFERNEEQERKALAYLAQWAYQFTPHVAIKAPDSLLLDITGCLRLFKGLDVLKQIIGEGLTRLGFTAMTGVSGTPLAALCHARGQLPDNTADVAAALQTLAIAHLEIDEAVTASLHQMGISKTGSLLALPAGSLGRRFGVYFIDYLARLTGNKPDPQKFIAPAPRFHNEITFPSDVSDTNALRFPIKRLLGELCDFLVARQLGINYLSWKLSHRSHPDKSFSIYLANPENDRKIFLPLTQLKLDQIHDVVEIDSITLAVNQFFPLDSKSGDLFEGTHFRQKDGRVSANDAQARADHLLNMLNARLGSGSCFGLSAGNDHRPERATKRVRLGQKPVTPIRPVADENPRPIFLLGTPRALHVIEGCPCLGGKLELLKGPERIDFGWWDQQTISKPIGRDYYIARQKNGGLFWVFNYLAPPEDRWYLHGIFS